MELLNPTNSSLVKISFTQESQEIVSNHDTIVAPSDIGRGKEEDYLSLPQWYCQAPLDL